MQAPTPPPLPAPAIPAAQFAGTYRDAMGKSLTIRSAANTIEIAGPVPVPLRRIGTDIFTAPADAPDTDAYIFTSDGVSHGANWFARAKARPTPQSYYALTGHYSSHNPEGPDARVFVRDGVLMMRSFGEGPAGDHALLPVDPMTFRLSSPEPDPERFRFDMLVDGQTLRMMASDQPLYRVDTP